MTSLLRRRNLIPMLVACLLVNAPLGSRASAAEGVPGAVDEFSLKAAFVYNFTKFTEWPADALADPTLRIGVLGADSFGERLAKATSGRLAHARPIEIVHVSTESEMLRCQLVFVGRAEDQRVADVLKCVARHPILTVGEGERFVERGGMIRLKLKDNRVRFEVNVAAADSAGLRLSSNLLQLADGVVRAGGGKE